MIISDFKNLDNPPINMFYIDTFRGFKRNKGGISFYFNGADGGSVDWVFDTAEERDKAYELILAKYTQNIWDLNADDPKHAEYLPKHLVDLPDHFIKS